MCGIAGYFVTRPDKIDPLALQGLCRELLDQIEARGRDAAGYAYISERDNFVYLAKAAVCASDFLDIKGHLLSTSSKVKQMPKALILHTRYATQGDPSNNMNNHPIYSKATGLCMVHNGWFWEDEAVVKTHDLTKDAEVDTETYLRLIDKFYLASKQPRSVETAIIEASKDIYGTVACAMLQGRRPNTLWLWRDDGLVSLFKVDWGYVFASLADYVLRAIYKSLRSKDLCSLEPISLPSDTILTIKDTGIERCKLEASAMPTEDFYYDHRPRRRSQWKQSDDGVWREVHAGSGHGTNMDNFPGFLGLD